MTRQLSEGEESWRDWAVHLRPAIQLIHMLVAHDFAVGSQHLPFIGVCVVALTSIFLVATQGIDKTFMEMHLAIEGFSNAHLCTRRKLQSLHVHCIESFLSLELRIHAT